MSRVRVILPAAFWLMTLASFLFFPRSWAQSVEQILQSAAKAEHVSERISLYQQALISPDANAAQKTAAAAALARLHNDRQDKETALQYYRLALENIESSSQLYIDICRQTAELALESGQIGWARELFAEAAAHSQNAQEKWVIDARLAVIARQMGNYDEALAISRRLLYSARGDESFYMSINIAELLSLTGDVEAALAQLRQLSPSTDEQNATVLWTRAAIFERAGDDARAEGVFQQLADDPRVKDRRKGDALVKLAGYEAAQGQINLAQSHLRQAVTYGVDGHQIALVVLRLVKQLPVEQQERLFGDWINELNKWPTGQSLLYKELGLLVLARGQKQQALAYFKQARVTAENEMEIHWLDGTIADLQTSPPRP